MDQQSAPHGAGATILKPSTTFLTACATMNWIAFQRAEHGDLTGQHSYARDFGYPPVSPPDFNLLDFAVAEAVDALTPHQEARLADRITRFGREWRELPAAREKMAQILAMRGCSVIELHIYMRARRDIWLERAAAFWSAQDQLKEALLAQKLAVWATAAAQVEPWPGYDVPAQNASAATVPWELFITRDVVVSSNGSILLNGRASFVDATFRSADVLALWPTSQPETTALSNAAAAWMRSHVTKAGSWKRHIAIRQCSSETGATYRDATAAWNDLPETLKGTRGAHKKP